MPSVDSLRSDPKLRAAMPLIYVAWADGLVTPEEIATVRRALSSAASPDSGPAEILGGWLDPNAPPSATDLAELLAEIRKLAAELSPTERRSLTGLGVELAALEHDVSSEEFSHDRVHAALLEVEQALGIAPHEAVRALLSSAPWPVRDRFDEPRPSFDPGVLEGLIAGAHLAAWRDVKRVLARPEFVLDDDDGTAHQRARVKRWLRILADEGFGALALPARYGGRGDMAAFIATFEALGLFDASLAVKFGVQFGLFGGSVLALGTDAVHARVLEAIGRGEMLGGFAMTELGHGSNVRDLETVATYDPARGVFVLDTPTESARKEWIGNAAEDGRFMTVFAKLWVDGHDHGVHALFVRIRNDDGSPVAGVRTEDCGRKLGLNGVDNGRIWFSKLDVPRDQLLARFGSVDAEGRYESPIPSASKRFFTMLGTLVGGRISVAGAANTAAKVGLAVALRYGALRRQFGPAGAPEMAILDYPEHQLRLLPRLAATVALGFSVQALSARFEAGGETDRELETRAAAIKALSTKNAIDTLQICRECCGGMGFLAKNRIGRLRNDVDVFATFEGENTVLLQLAAKSLLTDFRQQLSDDLVTTTLKLLAHRAGVTLRHKNPIGARRTDREHLVDPEFLAAAFAQRQELLLVSAARRIKRRVDAKMDVFAAFNDVQDHLLALARAFGERIVVDELGARVAAAPPGPEREVLDRLRALYCLVRMREDFAFFAENGFVEPTKARAIRKLVLDLCRELRPDVLGLVDALGVPRNCLAAPIAFEGYVKSEAL
jgi:acyl-CoA oxidase